MNETDEISEKILLWVFYSIKSIKRKIFPYFLDLSFPWVFKAYPVTSLMKQPLLRKVLQVSSIAAQGVAVVCMQLSRVGSEIMTCTNLAVHHRLKIIWMESWSAVFLYLPFQWTFSDYFKASNLTIESISCGFKNEVFYGANYFFI